MTLSTYPPDKPRQISMLEEKSVSPSWDLRQRRNNRTFITPGLYYWAEALKLSFKSCCFVGISMPAFFENLYNQADLEVYRGMAYRYPLNWKGLIFVNHHPEHIADVIFTQSCGLYTPCVLHGVERHFKEFSTTLPLSSHPNSMVCILLN